MKLKKLNCEKQRKEKNWMKIKNKWDINKIMI